MNLKTPVMKTAQPLEPEVDVNLLFNSKFALKRERKFSGTIVEQRFSISRLFFYLFIQLYFKVVVSKTT